MSDIVLHDVDAATLGRLAELASINQVTLEQQAARILDNALKGHEHWRFPSDSSILAVMEEHGIPRLDIDKPNKWVLS